MNEYLLCLPVSRWPNPRVESVRECCSKCRTQVWRALSSDPGPEILCLDCGQELAQTGEEMIFMPPTPKQVEAIKRYYENR
jgi:hypothetical protein